jgi:pimeloyl-ACP methyl ester carboxylesterase
MSHRVRRATIRTSRGPFAALCADPAGGVGDRQPALLVPGYTGSKEDFLSVLESLAAAGRTVTAIDMRGQYESDPAADSFGYELDELARDVVALAAAIDDDCGPVHLLGHSFGGLVARQAALIDPASFFSLTLLCSGPGTIGGMRARVLCDLLGYLSPAGHDVAQLSDMIARAWDSQMRSQAEADGTPPEIIEFLRKRTLRNCPLGLVEMARHLLACPDRTAELARVVTFPILVSYGENDDAWPPDIQDHMAKRLGAERVCIPGAGHSPPVEAPETTAAMLTAFWNHAELRLWTQLAIAAARRRGPAQPTAAAPTLLAALPGSGRDSRTNRTTGPASAGRRRRPGRPQTRT